MSETKTCTHCGRDLPHSAFPRRPKNRDGLSGQCRECTNARNRASAKRRRAKHGRWDQERTRDKQQAAVQQGALAKMIAETPIDPNTGLRANYWKYEID